MKSVSEVDLLAERVHAGQADKIGVPYIEHVRAVAAGLAPFGDELVMAGLLHDVVEDTDWTAEKLASAGIPERVVEIVEAVTNQAGMTYAEKIRHITADLSATLVKISDNAHNSRPAPGRQAGAPGGEVPHGAHRTVAGSKPGRRRSHRADRQSGAARRAG